MTRGRAMPGTVLPEMLSNAGHEEFKDAPPRNRIKTRYFICMQTPCKYPQAVASALEPAAKGESKRWIDRYSLGKFK